MIAQAVGVSRLTLDKSERKELSALLNHPQTAQCPSS
jgi:hypothetical protein